MVEGGMVEGAGDDELNEKEEGGGVEAGGMMKDE